MCSLAHRTASTRAFTSGSKGANSHCPYLLTLGSSLGAYIAAAARDRYVWYGSGVVEVRIKPGTTVNIRDEPGCCPGALAMPPNRN